METKSADQIHCSKCGQTVNPGRGVTTAEGRIHDPQDGCPDPNRSEAQKAVRQRNMAKAREARYLLARTQEIGIVGPAESPQPDFEGDSQGHCMYMNGGAMA